MSPLWTYRLDRTRRISWVWWAGWDDTALQTRDSNFEPWRSEAEHATSQSRRFPTILNHYEWAEKKHFVSLKLEGQSGVRTRDPRLSKQAALDTAPGPSPDKTLRYWLFYLPHRLRRRLNAKLTSGQHWSLYKKHNTGADWFDLKPFTCYWRTRLFC